MEVVDWIFLLAALVAAASAAAVVTRRNPVYSVLFMLPMFLALAVLFVFLSAPFMAAMQVMVYGGALMVVFLFVIMMINLKPSELADDFDFGAHVSAAALCGALCGGAVAFLRRGVTPAMEKAFQAAPKCETAGVSFGGVGSFGKPLFSTYVVPFELVSLLVVAALVGAVLLSKKKI